MRQEPFEQAYRPLWDELGALLDEMELSRSKRNPDKARAATFPTLYRQVCSHYALARSRRFSPALLEQLHHLVLRGHRRLYRQRGAWLWRILNFIGGGFPRALRRHRGYFFLALASFLLPALLLGLACYVDPDMIYSLMDERQVAEMESMYDPVGSHPGRSEARSSETDFMMFGFYIFNNIGIGFRTFAGGMLLGVGSLFMLLFNGLVLGGVAGHLTRLGYQDTFWSFVAGHGAFELTAIVICGAAGLMLGHALLAPGQRRRIPALKAAAAEALKLVLGAALMLLVAAFVEAFWSSSTLDAAIKYGVAVLLWALVVVYLVFVGRSRHGSL
ncbi:stage II sporulation protein M [endosymbiont of Lamellibrachia barhami]|uniref:stage II sporulation protein M n=1 Tax=endosymbiont of Lamellibrachia barhami TaxID=205975 RepID=UPI0015ADEBCF|nr:stage II sporulation protein M [endosymbiont of Lamellibrachia barhami]